MRKTIFFDVDTQRDFMDPLGALYVPGAEKIVHNLEDLTLYARQHGIPIYGSVDRHLEDDPELKRSGGPFPDHCMSGTEGQKKIEETAPINPIYVENREYSDDEIEKIKGCSGEIIFEKQSFNPFDNPNAARMVENVERAVVYGVATDYCVKATALALRDLGIEVLLVTDAIASVDVNPGDGERALNQLMEKGVKTVTTDDIISDKLKL